MKFPKIFFIFTKYYDKTPLKFVGFADFEALKGEDNIREIKLTKNIYEQVPIGVTLHMISELGNPSYFESFVKNCVRDFVESYNIYMNSYLNFWKL